MKACKNLFAIIFLLASVVLFPVACSKRGITGKVVDQEGAPVAGAPVGIAGSSHQTKTDSNGHYELSWVEGDVTIVTLPPPDKRAQYEEPKPPNFLDTNPDHITRAFLKADRYPNGFTAPNLKLINIPKRIAAEERQKAAEAAAKTEERRREELARQAREREIALIFEIHPEVVIHRQTGLMWHRSDSPSSLSHIEAMHYCDQLQAGGYTDWRLPTKEELLSLRSALLSLPLSNKNCFIHPFRWNGGYFGMDSYWTSTCPDRAYKWITISFFKSSHYQFVEEPRGASSDADCRVLAVRNPNAPKPLPINDLNSRREAILGSWIWRISTFRSENSKDRTTEYMTTSYQLDGTVWVYFHWTDDYKGLWVLSESTLKHILARRFDIYFGEKRLLREVSPPVIEEWIIEEFTRNRISLKAKDGTQKTLWLIGLRLE